MVIYNLRSFYIGVFISMVFVNYIVFKEDIFFRNIFPNKVYNYIYNIRKSIICIYKTKFFF